MPTYEYECPSDNTRMELSLSYDHEPPVCVVCGDTLRRVYTAPAIKFNGTGFYSTGG